MAKYLGSVESYLLVYEDARAYDEVLIAMEGDAEASDT